MYSVQKEFITATGKKLGCRLLDCTTWIRNWEFDLNFIFEWLHYEEIVFGNIMRSGLGRNHVHNVGRVAWEAFSTMWIVSAKSAFALGPRQTTRNFGLPCLSTCRLRAGFWATVRLSEAQNLAAVPTRVFSLFLKLYRHVVHRLPWLYVWMWLTFLFDSHHTATRTQELTLACFVCRNLNFFCL